MKLFETTLKILFLILVVYLVAPQIPLRASDTDDRIESSARKSYIFRTYLLNDEIHIKSKDGNVTLTGVVLDASHKSLARETIAELPGVKSIDNQLQTKDSPSANDTDAWIGEKVKWSLLFHRNVSASDTQVVVRNGNVTLTGTSESEAQKELTTEYARNVEGVRGVVNKMQVQGATVSRSAQVSNDVDDASITAQAKMTLLFHRSTSATNTRVKTENGIVTLTGQAKNPAEVALAGKLVGDINGVKSVRNEMTVEP